MTLNLGAGSALARGYMKIGETAHYELLTMEIYTRALRCILRPGRTAFKVTPKQGIDGGGLEAVRKLHLVLACAVVLAGGTADAPARPGRGRAAARPAGRRRRDRAAARADRAAPHPAHALSRSAAAGSAASSTASRATRRPNASPSDGHVGGRLVDASAAGVGLVLDAPLEVGARPPSCSSCGRRPATTHEVAAQVEVRSCREADGRFLVGATIAEIDPDSRMRLMEWCYVVCSHERLRGHRPAVPAAGGGGDRAHARRTPGPRRRRAPWPPSAAAGRAIRLLNPRRGVRVA